MLKGYTISSIKDIKNYPDLKRVQFTLSPYHFGKRDCNQMLKDLHSLRDYEIYIHYDYLHTATRFMLYSDRIKSVMLSEILKFYELRSKTNVKGIVIHTDSPFSQEQGNFLKVNKVDKFMQGFEKGRLYDQRCLDSLKIDNDLSIEVYKKSLEMFEESLQGVSNFVYLENTVRTLNRQNSEFSDLEHLQNFVRKSKAFGLCWDTEHDFASSSDRKSILEDPSQIPMDLIREGKLLVHANAIPKEVTKGSFRDRHSETTVNECSLYSQDQWINFLTQLNAKGIPWLREVKSETIVRETDQLSNLSL